MKDKRIWRSTCPMCGKRVTVGACDRIYSHKDQSGFKCLMGSGIKLEKDKK